MKKKVSLPEINLSELDKFREEILAEREKQTKWLKDKLGEEGYNRRLRGKK